MNETSAVGCNPDLSEFGPGTGRGIGRGAAGMKSWGSARIATALPAVCKFDPARRVPRPGLGYCRRVQCRDARLLISCSEHWRCFGLAEMSAYDELVDFPQWVA